MGEIRYRFGSHELGDKERVLLRDGVVVPIPAKALTTLLVLVQAKGRVVAKADLMHAIWPDSFVEEGSLTQNIFVLRKLLAADYPGQVLIETVPKGGYRFRVPVEAVEPSPQPHAPAPPAAIPAPAPESKAADEHRKVAQPADTLAPSRSFQPSTVASRLTWFVLVACALLVGWRLFSNGRSVVEASRPSIAILGFENLSGQPDAAWLSTAFTENLRSDLSASEGLRVIPAELVTRAERELALRPAASMSAESLNKVHRDLGCDLVVVGSYLIAGGRIRLNLSVQDAATAHILGVYTHTEDQDQVLPLTADAGVKLRGILHVHELTPESVNQLSAAKETNPNALKLYDMGLDRLRLDDGDGARPLLEKAVTLDPRSPLAHDALSRAWTLSGYDLKAIDEANKAVSLSGQLSRENQLRLLGHLEESKLDWHAAIETYRSLLLFFPDVREYGFSLATALISSGKPGEALQTLGSMKRQRPGVTEDDPRLLVLEADAFGAESQWPNALSAAQRGAAIAKSQGALILYERTLAGETRYLAALGETQQEVQTLDEATEVAAKMHDTSGTITLLLRRSGALRRARDLPAAEATGRQALELSQRVGARQRTIECLITLGSIARDGNDLHKAEHLLEQGLALARELGTPRLATLKLNLGNVENNLGYPNRARTLYMEALQSAQQLGDIGTQNILNGNLGILDYAEGDLDEGMRRLQLAIAGNRSISQKSSIAYDLGHVATIELMEGDYAAAHRTLDEQATLLSALGKGRGPQEQTSARASLAIAEGNLDQAELQLQAALPTCKDPGYCSTYNRELAELWLKRGDPSRARPFAEAGYKLAHTLSNPADYILPADLRMGEVDAALAQPAAARILFTGSRKQARALKLLPLELRARLDLAELQLHTAAAPAQTEIEKIQSVAAAHRLAELVADAAHLLKP